MQCHITKQLAHSFEVNIRISQPSEVTILRLINLDVNLKRTHNLYIKDHLPLMSPLALLTQHQHVDVIMNISSTELVKVMNFNALSRFISQTYLLKKLLQ